MQFSYEVKVPKDRIAVLVGVKGEVKKSLEKNLGIKISIDSEEGDIILNGDDSIALMTAQNIVKAIGRGFNPEIAFSLLSEENHFDMINIEDYSGDSKKRFLALRARVIGTDGKARKTIEYLTDTEIVVYGKTISIIGDFNGVHLARSAFDSLLGGSRHATVYAWLEKHRKNMKN
jgi:ribosomal RNA assembly protein